MCKPQKNTLFNLIFIAKWLCSFLLKSVVIFIFAFIVYTSYTIYFPSAEGFKQQFSKKILTGYETSLKVKANIFETCGARIGWLTSKEASQLMEVEGWIKTVTTESTSDSISKKFYKGISCDDEITREYYSLFYKATISAGNFYIEGDHTLTLFLPDQRLLLSLYYEKQ